MNCTAKPSTPQQKKGSLKKYSKYNMWSSVGLKSYLSFTIHFIDKEWTLQSRYLQAQFFPESHNGEKIAEVMLNALDSWNLKVENQVCLTADNGSNIVNRGVPICKFWLLPIIDNLLYLSQLC